MCELSSSRNQRALLATASFLRVFSPGSPPSLQPPSARLVVAVIGQFEILMFAMLIVIPLVLFLRKPRPAS